MFECPKTVQVFVVLADGFQHNTQEMGLFYSAADAEKHMATLSREWGNRRIEPRELPLTDVHDAHVDLLSDEHRAARAALLSLSSK